MYIYQMVKMGIIAFKRRLCQPQNPLLTNEYGYTLQTLQTPGKKMWTLPKNEDLTIYHHQLAWEAEITSFQAIHTFS